MKSLMISDVNAEKEESSLLPDVNQNSRKTLSLSALRCRTLVACTALVGLVFAFKNFVGLTPVDKEISTETSFPLEGEFTPAPFNGPVSCDSHPFSILGSPTDTGITISLFTDTDTSAQIFYRTLDTDVYQQSEFNAISSSSPQKYVLEGLKPNTKYEYILTFQNLNMGRPCDITNSPPQYFSTQKPKGAGYSFAVVADIHLHDPGAYDKNIFEESLTNLRSVVDGSQGIDFIVDIGDTFMGSKLGYTHETIEYAYQDIFRWYSKVANSAPLYLANGNHDCELGWLLSDGFVRSYAATNAKTSLALHCAMLRLKYYENPMPSAFYRSNLDVEFEEAGYLGNYYSWSWGDALFVVLDPFWYTNRNSGRPEDPWDWTLGKQQYDWLKETLEASDHKFKFLFIHHLVGGVFGTSKEGGGGGGPYYGNFFEWGGFDKDSQYAFDDQRAGWDHGPIHEMMTEYGVTAVFKGHDHMYHAGALDDVVYHTLPKPSVPNAHGHASNTAEAYERGYPPEEVVATSGFLTVDVKPSQVTVSYVTFDGQVWDKWCYTDEVTMRCLGQTS
mmetsp:Transcript_4416/g.6603  ORF Transcript_4416/g.6603 Transcript_4416/m.6603 type:complete len:558 (-) Transcript_4416:210-1883(-)